MFYANEIGVDAAPPAGVVPPELRHIFRTGTMYVAEREGRVVAFASAVTREPVTYLTDLFVHPREQSSRLGAALLRQTMPVADGSIRCTMSSTDYRALALYIRAGMRPQWPNFDLRAIDLPPEAIPPHGVEVHETQAGDPALAEWDREISGRSRPADLAYWVRDQRAVPLWITRQGRTIGYAYVRLGAGTIRYPQACQVGPVGAREAEDASACVWAAVEWARRHATVLHLDVPGAHPALAALLAAGFRIIYVETFVSTAETPFADPRRYAGSGGSLF